MGAKKRTMILEKIKQEETLQLKCVASSPHNPVNVAVDVLEVIILSPIFISIIARDHMLTFPATK